LYARRRNAAITQRELAKLGASAAQVVVEAKEGASKLRWLTLVIAALTLANTGFVIYSAVT
jgi:hypothetical protein